MLFLFINLVYLIWFILMRVKDFERLYILCGLMKFMIF